MTPTRGKILVIRGGAIGDFILTLPVLAALRRQFPDAELEVLGYPHIAQLAVAEGLATRVQSIEARALAGFFARNGDLAESLEVYFSEFNLIISYLYDPDEIFQANIGRCSRAQFIAGPHRPDDRLSLHATEVFLKPLERLAIFDADSVPRLEVEKAFETTALTGRWLAVHPGSGSESKNWPEQKWLELLQHLIQSTTLHLLIVGGEAERERVRRLESALPATRLKVLQNAPLKEVARWIASCVGFIGHDSGISHLAAAVGRRCLILWGGSAEAVWRPLAREMTVVRDSGGLEGLSVPVVINHLEQLLER